MALGASRARLMRQALTESLLLALIGGAAGCALAAVLLRIFVALAPEGILRLQQAAQLNVDARVLLFTLAVSLISGVVFGSAAGAGSGVGRHLFRQGLVAAQICASLILLTGASLLLRSLWNLENQPLGMRTDSVITASITLGQKTYSEAARQLAFFEELEARLGMLPGVTQVALSDSLPPSGPARSTIYSLIDVRGRARAAEGTGGMVIWRSVTPSYFAALGVPICAATHFTNRTAIRMGRR